MVCVFSVLALATLAAESRPYDPLSVAAAAREAVQAVDFTVKDDARKREIPIRVYLPPKGDPPAEHPVVLFSHGLGGSREGSPFLGKHWAARGCVCVFLQHPGSDESVWKDVQPRERMAAMQQAASASNLVLRAQDVAGVLDQLAKWNVESGHVLAGRLDAENVGMSGHSFGAQTTQAVSGQSLGLGGQRFTDKRIKAAVVMSPGVPKLGSADKAFGSVTIPWLLMTGTHDDSPIGGQTPQSRRGVYPALPKGDKYELVLDKAEHSVFTERALPGDRAQRNPNHHRAILALSTAFWDAYLRDDPAAKAWLTGDGPKSVLETADLWQHK
jgi:predicted dienelactone hydrolase